MVFQKPRLVIGALRGGAGKTVVSLGLTAAWRLEHGRRIVPFKKGPDYIDAGWLALAAGHDCYNLDPFFMKPHEMLCSFVRHSEGGDGSLIEGNRGLYDGVDVQGSFSTAELAKLLHAPVVLVVDATKVTRTAAALVLGCQRMDPEVNLAGVILNQVGGRRHEEVLRGAIEHTCGIPILGALPRERKNLFPERHLGLVPPQEAANMAEALEFAGQRMGECVDLEALWDIAGTAGPLGWPVPMPEWSQGRRARVPVRIGVIRDAAFHFYYPENLEGLEEEGATVQEISSLESRELPEIDALYIGGGFPETHLEGLSGNEVFRDSLRREIDRGLPVYAECGGLMYLCCGILDQQQRHFPMVGVFPFDVVLERRPQGHGYTILECVGENPFYEKGTVIKGHEFHYSRLVGHTSSVPFVFRMKKGHGIVAGWDGVCYKSALASYTHIHSVGNEHWARAMVGAAQWYRQVRTGGSLDRTVDPEGSKSGAYEYLNCHLEGGSIHGNG